MKITSLIVTFSIIFCTSLLANNNADNFMKQAQGSLEQKDFTKARYLYLQAYKAFSSEGNHTQAIHCGTKAAYLYYRENYHQEAFELFQQMNQLLQTEEQKTQQILYDQRFLLAKERLQMYIQLKNTAQAQLQLNALENLASQANSDKLTEDLLYIQVGYYYTFGQSERGEASFNKLISRYKNKKEYDKVSECYQKLITIARTANNTPLMERSYEKYITWTDSVKALHAQDKADAFLLKFNESQQTIQEKEDALAGKQYLIVGLCTLVAILIAALLLLVFLLLRFMVLNKKWQRIIRTTHEHCAQQTQFIQRISEQMKPTLDRLDTSAGEAQATAPAQAEAIQRRVDALKQFSIHLQELSVLESSLMEPYEVTAFNIGGLCKKAMDQIAGKIHPDVEAVVDVPQLEIKTNPEQLEHILSHLLHNAALHTTSGKIWLEFKRKGAHLCHIIVTDNGIGMPDEQKESLFKPFNAIKDLVKGDGLGLPICALIAQKLNGSLSIDMDYKKGCRFILVLHI